jgi:5-formyltetrahydrofolate cyclo-ligase
MDSNILRQQIRQQRRALSPAGQSLAANGLDNYLRQCTVMSGARHIATYLANDGEIDPAQFIHWASMQAKHCYLPVISAQKEVAMQFAELKPDTCFKPNRFGIPEPVVKAEDLRSAEALDIVLVPLVAFDLKGNRIGMGGGFYDRTLAFTREQPYDQRPKLIGLAHEFQYSDAIEPSAWDIPLDGIITEKQIRLFNP